MRICILRIREITTLEWNCLICLLMPGDRYEMIGKECYDNALFPLKRVHAIHQAPNMAILQFSGYRSVGFPPRVTLGGVNLPNPFLLMTARKACARNAFVMDTGD